MKVALEGAMIVNVTTKDEQGSINQERDTFIQSFKELTSHPLKMQIFFYLVSFGKVSLTNLSKMLNKPKTTVHHHVRMLEKKGILVSEEKVVKNFKEKYYSLKLEFLQQLSQHQKDQTLEKAHEEGRISLEHLKHSVRALTAFLYSLTERFVDFLNDDLDQSVKQVVKDSRFVLMITSKKRYEQFLKIVDDFSKEEDQPEEKSSIDENTWVIAFSGMPYGLMFKEFLENIAKDDEKDT